MADVRRGAEALPQVPLVEMSAEAVPLISVGKEPQLLTHKWLRTDRCLLKNGLVRQQMQLQRRFRAWVTRPSRYLKLFSPAATALNTWAEDVRSACSDITKLQEEWNAAVAEYNDVEAESASTTGTHGSGSVSHPDGNLAWRVRLLSSKQTAFWSGTHSALMI